MQGRLRSAVESIQPGDSRANLGELAHGVRALVETVRTPVELHLFSDMQKTGMPANFADMELPANVSVVLHPVGTAATPNWTVESVNAPAQLADPKDPKKSRVQAVIAGYGTPAASKNCLARRQRQDHRHPQSEISRRMAGQRLSFNRSMCLTDSTVAPSGSIRPTAFPRTTSACLRSNDPTRNGCCSCTRPAMRAHLSTLARRWPQPTRRAFTLQSIDSEKSADIDPSKYAFVVLSDAMALPSIFENALLRYVRGGGSVLIAAGTSAAHHARIPIYGGYFFGRTLLFARWLRHGGPDRPYPRGDE